MLAVKVALLFVLKELFFSHPAAENMQMPPAGGRAGLARHSRLCRRTPPCSVAMSSNSRGCSSP
ncbi:MAG: hypothetical protein WDN30_02565 [Pararobbsia sp.]